MTIYEMFKKNTELNPNKIAYEYFEEKGSYGQVLKQADVFSKYLVNSGIKAGDTVAVCMPNAPQLLVAMYGGNRIGARVIFLSPKSPANELRRQLLMIEAKALVFSTICAENVYKAINGSDKLKQIVYFYSSILKDMPVFFKFACLKKLYPFTAVSNIKKLVNAEKCHCMDSLYDIEVNVTEVSDDEEEAVGIFSGGTSGEYKVIVHSSKSMCNSAAACEVLVTPYPKEGVRMLAVLPAFHIFGLSVAIITAHYLNGVSVLIPLFHMNTIAKVIAKDCPHFIPGVPTIFKRVYECGVLQKYEKSGKLNVKNFMWGFCGGDYLDEETRKAFNELIERNGGKGYVSMGYGMSECCPISVCEKFSNDPKCVGAPFMGCEVSIRDEVGNPVTQGEKGEIYVYSNYLMKKYFHEDGSIYEPLVDDKGNRYIATGDIGFYRDGKLYYEHRMRRIIKVSGNTIFAGYVEDIVSKCEGVKETVVVAVKHPTRGSSTFAFVVPCDGVEAGALEKKVMNFCKNELLSYAIPIRIKAINQDGIKRTMLGKIVYGELERYAEELVNE